MLSSYGPASGTAVGRQHQAAMQWRSGRTYLYFRDPAARARDDEISRLVSVGRVGACCPPTLLLPNRVLDPKTDIAQLTPLGGRERL